MRFKIVDRYRYDLLEKMATRQEGYIEQIKINNKKLEELNQVIKMALLTLENQKKNLKIFSSRIGGLKASLKRKNTQNESLLTENNKLVEKISNVEKELEFKEQKIEFMKNSRKKVKNIEAYKNYFELRKELEKREKRKKGEQ